MDDACVWHNERDESSGVQLNTFSFSDDLTAVF